MAFESGLRQSEARNEQVKSMSWNEGGRAWAAVSMLEGSGLRTKYWGMCTSSSSVPDP